MQLWRSTEIDKGPCGCCTLLLHSIESCKTATWSSYASKNIRWQGCALRQRQVAIMSVRKYCVAPLPERRVHGRAAPALKHLTVAHQTLEGIFDSFHVVRTATGASDKD